jgi:hypothetical protein
VAAPEEFLDFLKLIARTYPRRPLHVIVDNASTHKTPEVQAWRPAPPHLRRSQGARSPWAWASPRIVENDVVETTALSVLETVSRSHSRVEEPGRRPISPAL